jgi:hypothetical protein
MWIIKIPWIISILSATILFIEGHSIFSIGRIINYYFPCIQEWMNSFPCYGMYDIYFMLLLVGIFISSLITIWVRIIIIILHKNKPKTWTYF